MELHIGLNVFLADKIDWNDMSSIEMTSKYFDITNNILLHGCIQVIILFFLSTFSCEKKIFLSFCIFSVTITYDATDLQYSSLVLYSLRNWNLFHDICKNMNKNLHYAPKTFFVARDINKIKLPLGSLRCLSE